MSRSEMVRTSQARPYRVAGSVPYAGPDDHLGSWIFGHSPSGHAAALVSICLLLLAAAAPIFFELLRVVRFSAVSYDDHAPYLLFILGEVGGQVPPSPFVYRIGAVILAAPFYILPVVPINGGASAEMLPSLTEPYLRATQAVIAANVFCVFAAIVAIATYCWRRHRVAAPFAFGASLLLMMVLSGYLALTSSDGITLLPVTLVVLALIERRVALFAIAVVLGGFVNEKVVLIALFASWARLLSPHRDARSLTLAVTAAAAFVAMLALIAFLPFPGEEAQKDPSTYLRSLLDSLPLLASVRGFYGNVWPILLAVSLWAVAMVLRPVCSRGASCGKEPARPVTHAADILVVFAIAGVALLLDVRYNVGRIALLAAPLIVPGAVIGLHRLCLAKPRTKDA